MTIWAVALGGALGAVARWSISGWLVGKFPAGTLTANLSGCLLMGLAMTCLRQSGWTHPAIQAFFVAGFLGSLTTFSTYAWQTIELSQLETFPLAALNLLANLAGGLAAVWAGMKIAQVLLG